MIIPSTLVLPGHYFSFVKEREFTPEDLNSGVLQFDPRYQRDEIKTHVSDLIQKLNEGGVCPDALWLSQRKDNSLWIVDGLQRYLAHWAAGKSLRGRIHTVGCGKKKGNDWETEAKIFHILNHRRTINAAHRAYTWTGVAGGLVRWLDTNEQSPLRGLVGAHTGANVPASTVGRGLYTALSGGTGPNAIPKLMEKLDVLVRANPKRAEKVAQMYAVVLRQVFPSGKTLTLPARGLAVMCHEVWDGLRVNQAWATPTRRSVARIRAIKWSDPKVLPSQNNRWLPTVVAEIRQRWNVAA